MHPQIKTLAADRLQLVPFDAAYLTEKYVGWLNDADVVRYSDQRFHQHTLESCRQYTESFAKTSDCLWAIVSRDESLGHVGNICAAIEPYHAVADISILVGEKRIWGKGIGLEAWQAVCNFLFRDVGIRKITAGTLAVNQGMRRVMQKTGMQEEGRRLRQHLIDNRPVDIIYYGLFAEEYLGKQAA